MMNESALWEGRVEVPEMPAEVQKITSIVPIANSSYTAYHPTYHGALYFHRLF